jgi:hypothetical protein
VKRRSLVQISLPLLRGLVKKKKKAFLNGYLDEEAYMEQLEGFIIPGQENEVYKLVRSLYGLK